MAAPYYALKFCAEHFDNAHSLNLENCLLYLSSTIKQFFDFVRCIVFDFIFYCMTVHTLYSAARRMAYAKKFSIGIEKCKCKV